MKILFVCTGNICRSVIAEEVFRFRAKEILGERDSLFEVESSGLDAETGEPPNPECLEALGKIGISPGEHHSRMLNLEQISDSDLVVTMTRQQSYVMASRFPEHKSRFFSLIELNGAIETLSGAPVKPPDVAALRGSPQEELRRSLASAAGIVRSASRIEMRPIAGVPLSITELMTRFSTCFNQVSGVHDPIGGTAREYYRCAVQLKDEVTDLVHGLLNLALSEQAPPR